jgi:hypothetical protein
MFLIAYLSTSSLVLIKGCLWLIPALGWFMVEWDDGRYQLGEYLCAWAALGAVYLVAAREHLVLRWPGRGLAIRFAMAYQIVGLSLINWAAFTLAWFGWDGEGYHNVPVRLACVTATVVFYGLEVWAGQNSGMPWVSGLGVLHFLVQTTAILGYYPIPLQHRALLVIGFALLLILVAQGESARRR